MSNFIPFEVLNTGFTYNFIKYRYQQRNTESTTTKPYYQQTIQSPSITASGNLWQQELARLSSNTVATIQGQNTQEAKSGHGPDRSEQKRVEAIQLLNSWREEDEQEQKETLEYLERTLDEDRLSDRKLFP